MNAAVKFPRSHCWKFVIWLLVLGLPIGCQPARSTDSIADSHSIGTVELILEFPTEASNHNLHRPLVADMTVLELMEAARSDGQLEFVATGTGVAAFVVSIDGVTNQGGAGKNWIFYVNGLESNQGCGSVVVNPGDVIRWKFGEYSVD